MSPSLISIWTEVMCSFVMAKSYYQNILEKEMKGLYKEKSKKEGFIFLEIDGLSYKTLQKALDTFNLTYIDIPYFVDKDAKHPYSAIGIYVNYLEVNDLIVVPIFNSKEDQVAIDVIKKAFPNKTIEKINYNDVAKEGGLLNCTTWTYKR